MNAAGRKGPARAAAGMAAVLVAAAVSVLMLAACTGSPPEILEILWEVRLEEDREGGLVYESLSLFVKPNDPDGSEDLEALFLIQDDQELFWHLDPDSWVQSGSGQELWIGSNAFRLQDGSPLPDGEYRVLLRDVAGGVSERTIQVKAPALAEARRYLPEIAVTEGSIRLPPSGSAYTLWLYSLEDAYVASVEVRGSSQALGILRTSYPALEPGFRFKVYARVEALNLGIVSGLYSVGR